MAQPASVAFATLLAGSDLIVDNEVTLDLPSAPQYDDLSLAVESIQIQRSMVTTAPAATRMWTGYPSVSATIVLSGLLLESLDGLTIEELASPYNPASPLFRELLLGVTVKIRAGLWVGDVSAELLDQFAGLIDSYDIDPANGTVTLNCLDLWSTLTTGPNFTTLPTDPFYVVWRDASDVPLLYVAHPGLTNLFIVDTILRNNGIFASPDQRASCCLYASLAGSALPTVYDPKSIPTFGDTSASYLSQRDMIFVPGYFTGQVPRDFHIHGGINRRNVDMIAGQGGDDVPALNMGEGWLYEGWHRFDQTLDWTDRADESFNTPQVSVSVSSGGRMTNNTIPPPPFNDNFPHAAARVQTFTIQENLSDYGQQNPSAPWQFVATDGTLAPLVRVNDGAWHQITVQNTLPTTTSMRHRVYVDQVLVLDLTVPIPSTDGSYRGCEVDIASTLPGESINITAETNGAPLAGFAPGAFLDASLNALRSMINQQGQGPGALLQLCADSEFAAVGFDETGFFRFQNRYTLRDMPVAADIASNVNLLDIQPSVQSATAANVIEVPITNVTISDFGPLYVGPSGQVIKLRHSDGPYASHAIALGDMVTSVSPFVYQGNFPVGGFQSSAQLYASGARFALSLDGAATPSSDDLQLEVWQSDVNEISYTLGNPMRKAVYLVTPEGWGYPGGTVGSPFFAIAGRVISFDSGGASVGAPAGAASVPLSSSGSGSGPTAITSTSAGAAPARSSWVKGGARRVKLQIAANDLIQDLDVAQQLADDVLDDLVYPRPLLQNVSVIADPRRQLGDRARVVDPDLSRMDDDVVVVADTLTISAVDWTQQPTLRAVAQPGYWVAGETGKSELAVSAWT